MNTVFIFGAQYLYLFIIGLVAFYFLAQPRDRQKGVLFFSLASMSFAYLIAVLALIVGASRVYVGIHHWADILGSVLIAILATYTAFLILKNPRVKILA